MRGGRNLRDDKMAEIAARAVVNGHLVPNDIVELLFYPGGRRILSVVEVMLLDVGLDRPVSPETASKTWRRWQVQRAALNRSRARERANLERYCQRAIASLQAASAAIAKLHRSWATAKIHHIQGDPTPRFRSSLQTDGGEGSIWPLLRRELCEAEQWAVALAEQIAAAVVREADFEGADLPPRDPLDAEQNEFLSKLVYEWPPEDEGAFASFGSLKPYFGCG
jgi:hypothetical protein